MPPHANLVQQGEGQGRQQGAAGEAQGAAGVQILYHLMPTSGSEGAAGERGRGGSRRQQGEGQGDREQQGCKPHATSYHLMPTSCQSHANLILTLCQPRAADGAAVGGSGQEAEEKGAGHSRGEGQGQGGRALGVWRDGMGLGQGADW